MQTTYAETTADLDRGLDSEQVRRRLAQYGYNEVPEKKATLRFCLPRNSGALLLDARSSLGNHLVSGKHLEFYLNTGPHCSSTPSVVYFQENRANAAFNY